MLEMVQNNLSIMELSILKSIENLICLQGICPGLTHGQKFGISYISPGHRAHEDDSRNQGEQINAESHSIVIVQSQNSDYSPSENKNYHEKLVELHERKQTSDPPKI